MATKFCTLTEGVGENHDGSDRAAVHLGPAEAANQIRAKYYL